MASFDESRTCNEDRGVIQPLGPRILAVGNALEWDVRLFREGDSVVTDN